MDAQRVTEMTADSAIVDEGEQRTTLMPRLAVATEMFTSDRAEPAGAIGRALLAVTEAPRAAVFFRSPNVLVTCSWSHNLSDAYVRTLVTPDGVNL